MKRKKVLFLLLMPLMTISALQPDANEVMEKSRDMTLMGSLKATISLSIREKNGSVRNRTISIVTKSYPGETEKRLIRFIEPADVRGTGMLIIDNKASADEMWIYLPALKKTRRVVSSEKGKSFMNSEFSNSDMSSPTLSDFNTRHLAESGQNNTWIIESVPASEEKIAEYGYSRKVSYISTDSYIVKKMEFYNRDNRLFKIIDIVSVQPGRNGKYLISEMKAENLENGRSSAIKFTNISMDAAVEDSFFTLQNLER